jgi:3-oxoacyl-(acyl-carrier-protein) synthase/acyl-CoA synthetase (AMP-forming)/AMP-acid ligase II/acyl carrier protein
MSHCYKIGVENIANLLLFSEPNREIIYIDSNGIEDRSTHGKQLKESVGYSKWLKNNGVSQGDYIILSIEDEIFFFKSFWACFLIGAIPVPLDVPINNTNLEKFKKVWETLDRCSVLCLEGTRDILLKNIDEMNVIVFNDIETIKYKQEEYIPPIIEDDTIAMIQFSSGSTGDPKGIKLSHKNILSNIEAIQERVHTDEKDVILCWMPHTHDFGIFGGHFSPIFSNSKSIKLSPKTFIKKPNLIVTLLDKFSVSIFSSPNFGLNWILKNFNRKVVSDINLSSIRLILNGAEPISVDVVESFLKKFYPYGLSPNVMLPVYGLAEATLAVTMPTEFHYEYYTINKKKLIQDKKIVLEENKSDETKNIKLVSVGKPLLGFEVEIRDNKGIVLKENAIGTIFIKGDSVTKGYVNDVEVNANIIKDDWLNTGDVGCIIQGNLVLCDRIKNMACINGINVFFKDLEETIYLNTTIERGNCLAISCINKLGIEHLVFFLKNKGKIEKILPQREEIIKIISDLFQIRVNVVIPIRNIPKTTSGKPRREWLKESYLLGEYSKILIDVDEEINLNQKKSNERIILEKSKCPITKRIRSVLSKSLDVPEHEIENNATFQELGMSSIEGLQFLVRLEEDLGLELEQKDIVIGYTFIEFCGYCKLKITEEVKQEDVKEKNSQTQSAVSIIGMSCRFPGAVSLKQFQHNLETGTSFFAKVSEKRKEQTGYPLWDEYLAEMDNPFDFDSDFFSISEEEAKFIDPQQRICLELAYEAIIDAGILQEVRKNQKIGVFIGASFPSYNDRIIKYINEAGALHPNTMANNTLSMIATRISKYFGFRGAAVVIDSACSSSLVALDFAIKEVLSGRIDKALVGGVNLIMSPHMHELSKAAGILSGKGECRVFDEDASGTVLGEGAGFVVLEKEEKCIRNRHYCYANIISTCVNNDGTALSIMAPNVKGQSELIEEALINSQVHPDNINYIEAHGTATSIGDPVELMSLTKVFKDKKNQCQVGSVKSNIGHLLAASGMAGLIKTALSLKKNIVYPTLHVSQENTLIDFENTPFRPAKSIKRNANIKYAGVSSFGFGGTNSHIVLKAPQHNHHSEEETYFSGNKICVFGISWRNEIEKTENISQIIKMLLVPDVKLYPLCVNSLLRTEHRGERKIFLINSKEELITKLTLELDLSIGKRTFKIQLAGLLLSETDDDIKKEEIEAMIPYLEKNEIRDISQIDWSDKSVNKIVICYWVLYKILKKYTNGVKMISVDGFGDQIEEFLIKKVSITDILKHNFEISTVNFKREKKSVSLPLIGISEENLLPIHSKVKYFNFRKKSTLEILAFYHGCGLDIQWHKIVSLRTIPNWNHTFHRYKKKTLLV